MQTTAALTGLKPSKWYFSLTTQVLVAIAARRASGVATIIVAKSAGELDESVAIMEYRRHFGDPAITRI